VLILKGILMILMNSIWTESLPKLLSLEISAITYFVSAPKFFLLLALHLDAFSNKGNTVRQISVVASTSYCTSQQLPHYHIGYTEVHNIKGTRNTRHLIQQSMFFK
jgi:hypothetical protein